MSCYKEVLFICFLFTVLTDEGTCKIWRKGCFKSIGDLQLGAVIRSSSPRVCTLHCQTQRSYYAVLGKDSSCSCLSKTQPLISCGCIRSDCLITVYVTNVTILKNITLESSVIELNQPVQVNVEMGTSNLKEELKSVKIAVDKKQVDFNISRISSSEICFIIRSILLPGYHTINVTVEDGTDAVYEREFALEKVEAKVASMKLITTGITVHTGSIVVKTNTRLKFCFWADSSFSYLSIDVISDTSQGKTFLLEKTHTNCSCRLILEVPFEKAGLHSIKAVFHRENVIYHKMLRKGIIVQDEIQYLCLGKNTLSKGTRAVIKVAYVGPSSGVTFSWFFGNESKPIITGNPECSFTAKSFNTFELQVIAKNLVSRKQTQRMVYILFPLKNVRLFAPSNPILEGVEVVFNTSEVFGNIIFLWSLKREDKSSKRSRDSQFKTKFQFTGRAEVEVQLFSEVNNITLSHIVYIIKKIEPFPVNYQHFNNTWIKLSVPLDVNDYYANFFNASYNPRFEWNFGDGSKVVMSDKPSISHIYDNGRERSKIYVATVKASNILSNYSSKTKVFIKKVICNIQIYFPWRYGITKEFKLSDNITFLPVVDINCPGKQTYHWQYQDDNSKIFTLSKELSFTVPALTFGIGRFRFNFSVLTTRNVTRSYLGELLIKPSGLQAKIVDGGVRYISQDPDTTIKLNGSASFDVDDPLNKTGLRYKWDCYVQSMTVSKTCSQSNFSWEAPEIQFRVKDLVNASKILFILTVSKNNLASTNATIFLLKANIAKSSRIECISCIGINQSSAIKSVFIAKCPNCKGNEHIAWSVYAINRVTNLFKTKFGKCLPTKWPNDQYALGEWEDKLDQKKKKDTKQCSYKTPTIHKDIVSTIIQSNCDYREAIGPSIITTTNSGKVQWMGESHPSLTYSNSVRSTSASKTYESGLSPGEIDSLFLEERSYQKDIELVAPHGINKVMLVINRNVFIPSFEYIIKLRIYRSQNRNENITVGLATFTFSINQSPEKGSCEAMVTNGKEIITKFTIRCKKWESQTPITYTMQILIGNITHPEKEQKFDILLATRQHRFDFFLTYITDNNADLHENRRDVHLQVAVENSLGSRMLLCKLMVSLQKNPAINANYLYSRVNEMNGIERFDSPSRTFYELSAMTVKLNSLTSNHLKMKIRENICKLVTKLAPKVSGLMLANWMKLFTNDVVNVINNNIIIPDSCTKLITIQMGIVVKASAHTFWVEHNGDHHNFVDDMFRVMHKLLSIFKRSKDWNGIEKIMKMQHDFAKIVGNVHYSEETYIQFSAADMNAFGVKTSLMKIDVDRNVSMQIQNAKHRFDVERCFDVFSATYDSTFYAVFKNSKQYLSFMERDSSTDLSLPRNTLWSDVRISDCSEKAATELLYHMHIPVSTQEYKYRLNWEKTNSHYINVTSKINAVQIFINVNKASANHDHFYIDMSLRNHNFSTIRKVNVYPPQCSDWPCNMTFEGNTLEVGSYVFSLEIKSPHRKVVSKPWFNYSIAIVVPHCISWKKFNISDSCKVTTLSTIDEIICRCEGSALVSGYMTDVPQMMTAHSVQHRAFGSMIPVICACAIFFIYLFLVLWYWNSKSTFVETVSNHPENHPCDIYKYILLIETGYMWEAGTTSRVCAVIYGKKGHSEKLELTNNNVDLFQRGATDVILISCPQYLGKLTHLNIWHNHQGTSPDWYIKQIKVKDISSGETFYFPFHNWLSLSRGIRHISCRLVATKVSCHSVIQNMLEKFLDYHLWLSVIVGPKKSSFSTFERLSCLMAAAVFYFSASIYVFHDEISQNQDLLSIFHISSAHIVLVAAMTAYMHVPLNIVLSCFFRNSILIEDPNKKIKSAQRKRTRKNNKVMDSYQLNSVNPPIFETKQTGAMHYNAVLHDQISLYELSPESEKSKDEGKWSFDLPYHVRTIAVVFTFLIIIFGMFCIWRTSTQLPVDLVTSWMQLVCMALTLDVFIITPLVAIVQCCLSQFWKSWATDYINFDSNSFCLKNNKVDSQGHNESEKALEVRLRARFIRYAQPLAITELKKKKNKLGKKLKLKKTVKKLLFGACLLVVAILIVSEERIQDVASARTFVQNKLMVRNISSIITIGDFWNWTEETLPSFVSYENWHWSFDQIKRQHSDEYRTIGVALMERKIGSIIESTSLVGNRSHILQTLRYNDWFNGRVSSVIFKSNVMTIFNGNPMYSAVEVKFEKCSTGLLKSKENIETVFVDFTDVNERINIITCEVILGILIVIMAAKFYCKSLEKSWSGLCRFTTVLDAFLLLSGASVSLSHVIELIAGYYLQDILASMEFDDHEGRGVYLNISLLIHCKQFIYHVKAIFLFTVLMKSIFLLKLISVTYILIKVMKHACKKVFLYMVYITIFIVACSHTWYLLCHTHSESYKTFGDVFKYIVYHLPRPNLTTEDISSEQSSFYILFGAFCSVLLWVGVKMSCIYFIGAVRKRKMKINKRKLITLPWILRKCWKYLSDFIHLKRLCKKKKKTKDSSKIPKKHIFEEIDYQLEEMLYRVNKLVEQDKHDSGDEYDESCAESSSYFTDEPSTSAGTTTDTNPLSACDTTDVLYNVGGTNSSLRRTKNLLSCGYARPITQLVKPEGTNLKSYSNTRQQCENASLQPNLRSSLQHPNIVTLQNVGNVQSNSGASFQRFSLASIMEGSTNETTLTKPVSSTDTRNSREFRRVKIMPFKVEEDDYVRNIKNRLERLQTGIKSITPEESESRLKDIQLQKGIYDDLNFCTKHNTAAETSKRKQTSNGSSAHDNGLDSSNSNINMAYEHEQQGDTTVSNSGLRYDFGGPWVTKVCCNVPEEILESERRHAEMYRKLGLMCSSESGGQT